jgi:hypothetical protein
LLPAQVKFSATHTRPRASVHSPIGFWTSGSAANTWSAKPGGSFAVRQTSAGSIGVSVDFSVFGGVGKSSAEEPFQRNIEPIIKPSIVTDRSEALNRMLIPTEKSGDRMEHRASAAESPGSRWEIVAGARRGRDTRSCGGNDGRPQAIPRTSRIE